MMISSKGSVWVAAGLAVVLCFSPSAWAQKTKTTARLDSSPTGAAGESRCDATGSLGPNCGFETGGLAAWAQSGDTSYTGVSSGAVAHTGQFGLSSGPVQGDGFVTLRIPAIGADCYDLSFWLRNRGTPNRFSVAWNGAVIYRQENMGDFSYLSSDALPEAGPKAFTCLPDSGGDSNTVTFGFYNVPDYFWLDDVTIRGHALCNGLCAIRQCNPICIAPSGGQCIGNVCATPGAVCDPGVTFDCTCQTFETPLLTGGSVCNCSCSPSFLGAHAGSAPGAGLPVQGSCPRRNP